MTTTRAKLRQVINEKLVPVLLAAGFKGPTKVEGNSLSHEYRRNSSLGTQVLSIQFEKYQRPRFVLNLHIEREEGNVNCLGRLKAKPGGSVGSWFRADRPWWQRVILRRDNTLEVDAVEQCVAVFSETE